MIKLNSILDFKYVKDFLLQLPQDKQEYLKKFVLDIPENFTQIKKKRRTENFFLILKNNNDSYFELYEKYTNSSSQYEKTLIKYGKKDLENYKQKLKARPLKINGYSHWNIEHWLMKGYSRKESEDIIKNIKSPTKGTNWSRETRELHKKIRVKIQLKYWTEQGYSKEEALILRQPYMDKCKNDLNSMIIRHGEEEGTIRYLSKIEKYKNTIRNNFGNRRCTGHVSKESLKFFIPLYKKIRKLGFKRKDINFGLRGSREFFIKDISQKENCGYFYDFTINKIKLIIEYNGTFWHPKNLEDWRNPFESYENAILKERYKEKLAKERGFSYFVVWSDDDKQKKTEEILEFIKNVNFSR